MVYSCWPNPDLHVLEPSPLVEREEKRLSRRLFKLPWAGELRREIKETLPFVGTFSQKSLF